MSNGELKCCGSPLFLKSKYGSGYNLTITRKNKTNQNNMNDTSTKTIIEMIFDQIPNSQLNSNVNNELSFILPTNMSHKFPELFNYLDNEKENLNILNVGISITTVEEVFLK